MITEYKEKYYFLSRRFFSRFEIEGKTFETVDKAYEYYVKEEYTNEENTMLLHYLYKATLAKFNQNLFLQDKLLKIDPKKFDVEDDYGNVLYLVHETIARAKKIKESEEESKTLFGLKILE